MACFGGGVESAVHKVVSAGWVSGRFTMKRNFYLVGSKMLTRNFDSFGFVYKWLIFATFVNNFRFF